MRPFRKGCPKYARIRGIRKSQILSSAEFFGGPEHLLSVGAIGISRQRRLAAMHMLRRRQLLTLTLIACALFLRAIVPTGWMPAAHAGVFAVEPCPSAGPAAMMHMGGVPGHHGDHKTDHDCFASALAGAGLPDAPVAFATPSPLPITVRTVLAPTTLNGRNSALPPPATGPPSLA